MHTVVRERRASEREEPQEVDDATETPVRTQRTEQTCGSMPQKQAQKRQEQAVTGTPPKQSAGTGMRASGSGRARKGIRTGKHQQRTAAPPPRCLY